MLAEESGVAKALRYIAWGNLVAGFVLGIVLGNVEVPSILGYGTKSHFMWAIAIPWWIAGVVSCVFALGFAEVVDRLVSIHAELREARHERASERRAAAAKESE